MKDGDLIQVAYVVRNLEEAMNFFSQTMKVGPWAIYTFAPPAFCNAVVRGKPSDHTFRIALAEAGPVQIELIQPLTGRSVYDEHLEKRGEGLHHVKFYYADCQKALQEFAAKGISVIQSGKFDEDEHYYLDTEKYSGILVEIGNNGKMRPPERWFPSE
jgi:4-hydroxyphenylpyruvate dioxygenase-like putative hemolysin